MAAGDGQDEAKRDRARPPAWREVLAIATGVLLFVSLIWLIRGELGMTWDEPYFFERQHDIRTWVSRLFGTGADRARALSAEGLARSWRVCREVPDQHPPLPEILSVLTGVPLEGIVGPLRAYRLSTVLVFALTGGVLHRFVRQRWGRVAALAALAALVFNPRVFADAQQITADADLGAFWFLSALAFLHTCTTGRAPWAFGVLAGLAVMCKATGVLVLPAMTLWAILFRPRGWWRPLAWAVPAVPATMLVLNPAWWPSPIMGMLRWVRAFLSYPQKVPVYYLGKVYDSIQTFIPWHNTVVLTSVMMPVGLLVLAFIGIIGLVRELARRKGEDGDPTNQEGQAPLSDRAVLSWAAINFLTLMTLRMFSFMPAHDGLRQLVPAFYFLPVLAGYGAWVVCQPSARLTRGLGYAAVAVCLINAGWATIYFHPYELAYYNILIGGPRGAERAGMETTYFWDAATEEVLDWMNTRLPPGAKIIIFPPPNVRTFGWEQRWGRLRPDLNFLNMDGPDTRNKLALLLGPDPCYLIFLNRQGLYEPARPGDPETFARLAKSPAFYELVPKQVRVRLLAIFTGEQFRAAVQAGKSGER
jgi:hypothetical protein